MDNGIVYEIDKLHQMANEALGQKQFNTYMNFFSDQLQYKPANGRVLDKRELATDIAYHFGHLKEVNSQYKRTNHTVADNGFTENLVQKAAVSVRVFIFFTKKWTIEREAIYKWIKTEGSWSIESVEVLTENVY